MMRTRFRLMLLSLLVFARCGLAGRERLQIGDVMPSVSLNDTKGHAVTLPQAIKGKVAVVRLWAVDCSQCNKQLLFSLESLYQKYKDKGFLPVAIHEGRPEGCEEKLRKFDQLSYPMLLDEYRTAALRFGIIGLPTTFILDERGIVREKIIGETDAEQFEKLLTTVLYKGGSYDSAY